LLFINDYEQWLNHIVFSSGSPEMIGLLSLHIRLPGCQSLKEKRSRLKPLLARLHKEFNLSAAEMDLQDRWDESILACAMVGNDRVHLEQSLQKVPKWVHHHWPDVELYDDQLELI
jgi:uncharacterized protein YlxP (DUF503 family)